MGSWDQPGRHGKGQAILPTVREVGCRCGGEVPSGEATHCSYQVPKSFIDDTLWRRRKIHQQVGNTED